MSDPKKLAALLGLMLAANIGYNNSNPINNSSHNTMTDDEKNIKNGLKKFYFGAGYVWASNKKTATKKQKN